MKSNSNKTIKRLARKWVGVSLFLAAVLAGSKPAWADVNFDAKAVAKDLCSAFVADQASLPNACGQALDQCAEALLKIEEFSIVDYNQIHPEAFKETTQKHAYKATDSAYVEVIDYEFIQKHQYAVMNQGNVDYKSFQFDYDQTKSNVLSQCTRYDVNIPEIAKTMCDALRPQTQSTFPGTCFNAVDDCNANVTMFLVRSISNYNLLNSSPFEKVDDSNYFTYQKSVYQEVIQNHFIQNHQFYAGALADPYWNFENPSFQSIQRDMESRCKTEGLSAPLSNGDDSTPSAGTSTGGNNPSAQSIPVKATPGGGCSLGAGVPSGNASIFLTLIPLGGLSLIRKRKRL